MEHMEVLGGAIADECLGGDGTPPSVVSEEDAIKDGGMWDDVLVGDSGEKTGASSFAANESNTLGIIGDFC